EDLRVAGLVDVLLGGGKLLEELLARPNAREDDVDVLVRPQTGETDEVDGEVEDLHGFAHVEDEDLAALAHASRLQDELAGLGDGHEIAAHLRVRDRDRPALLQLLAEDG